MTTLSTVIIQDSLPLRIRDGLQYAIEAVNLNIRGKINEAKTLETSSKEVLEYLANPDTNVNRRISELAKDYSRLAEGANNTFPRKESLSYLQKLAHLF